uniref:Endonuclease n=1 Tax=Globisporangium ultimum (strain ATCC 200006 / CBS 805.95 / DAOM BR144) TaxID=431595 RepID=K3W6L3_GLOUD
MASYSGRVMRLSTLTGVAVGIGIGSIGVLLLVGQVTEEKRDQDRQTPADDTRKFMQHEALRYGLPSTANVHVRSGYVVSYDYRTRNASWVLEYLTKDSLRVVDDTDRTKANFHTDVLTPEQFRVHPNVFLKSGYDKGHLAPARDMTNSQQAMNESFLMTNISPQVGVGFNRGYWSRFEGFVRHLAGQFDGVYVVTGPLFLPNKNKKTGEYQVKYPVLGTPPDAIAVPTHFFKVVLGRKKDGTFATAGFILPNKVIPDKKDLMAFHTPVKIIEKYAGLLFFDKVR